jgi:hypothetical protein
MKYSLPFLLFLFFFIYGCSLIQTKNRVSYSIYLDKNSLKRVDFKGHNLIATKMGNQWYFVKRDGKAMPVMSDDKGNPDKFKEGLARAKIDGKIGFFNRDLDMVIEPFYDYAFPFHNGIADICVGCREVQNDDGSTMLDGGKWKRIDRKGLIIEE